MSNNPNNLSGESTISTWLADPAGGPVFRAMLAQGGQDGESLRPVSKMALNRLVQVSQGAFTQEMVDALVLRVEAGDIPVETAAQAPVEASGPETPPWVEKVTTGRFSGKTIIITGAGSGIGRATASRVAREGGRVVAVDISAERLADFAASLPEGNIVSVSGDITDDAAVAAIVEAAGERIDGLANIAGIMDNMTPVHEVADDVWNRVFNINVNGTMKLMRAVVPAMLAQAQGSIVNVASEAALRGSAAGAAYTASKHAVAGLTKSSAFMYGPSGIRVNAVAPGPVITNIEARFDSELGASRVRRAMAVLPDPVEGDALAASITFLLSDDGVNVNGVILPSDGGWSAA
ncbi:NADP-dependent 3-hydroxy acid dehydrogenase YdfG [Arthrobacter alpinus]|uniref:NADP-dependent 3-hydroxy acid dehydrogenase YdfG n=1 Tax=Arthrobacter alpinus TaxID=656366 RepID=A0A1H5ELX9_9MICC|nr:SDR family NAD(P)-dependent oxidoreductase [Arthrobacter alpinus]SED92105.1 NADP-dependent 3-hydroxy acid dehydrogenase YdfG [Arthrobacter alpinus]